MGRGHEEFHECSVRQFASFTLGQECLFINCVLLFRTIYSQIARALGDHPDAANYNEKASELLPSMRFCAYQTGAGNFKINEVFILLNAKIFVA